MPDSAPPISIVQSGNHTSFGTIPFASGIASSIFATTSSGVSASGSRVYTRPQASPTQTVCAPSSAMNTRTSNVPSSPTSNDTTSPATPSTVTGSEVTAPDPTARATAFSGLDSRSITTRVTPEDPLTSPSTSRSVSSGPVTAPSTVGSVAVDPVTAVGRSNAGISTSSSVGPAGNEGELVLVVVRVGIGATASAISRPSSLHAADGRTRPTRPLRRARHAWRRIAAGSADGRGIVRGRLVGCGGRSASASAACSSRSASTRAATSSVAAKTSVAVQLQLGRRSRGCRRARGARPASSHARSARRGTSVGRAP